MNYCERVKKGLEIANKSKCFICGLARSIAPALISNIPQIERLARLFDEYVIYVHENDSVDETKDILEVWSEHNPFVHVRTSRFNHPRITDLSVRRIVYMSEYRNSLVEQLESGYQHYDFMVMVDLDLAGFSINGVMNTLGWDDWDAVGSNGRKDRSESRNRNIYYDAFAHRELDEPIPRTQNLQRIFAKLQDKYKDLMIGESLVPVASCFNGLALYRVPSVLGCRYSAYYGYAEHVGLHEQMSRFNRRIFINPSQVTYYDRLMAKYWMQKEDDIISSNN